MKKKNFFAVLAMIFIQIAALAGSCDSRQANTRPATLSTVPEEQSIQLPGGVNLKYAETGNASGTPIIFLHGFPDSWRSYQHVLSLLPEGFHTLAVSQRAHGNSSDPGKGYAMKDFAADIAAFIRLKKLGPCIIAGHSMGGIIAQQFAIDYPGLTRALVLIGTDSWFGNNQVLLDFKEELQEISDPVDYSFAEAFQKSTLARPVDPQFIDQCIKESMKLPAANWKIIFDNILAANCSGKIHKINSPTLILWGSRDSFCSFEDQNLMQQRIKNSKLIVYEGNGHSLHWEDPRRFVDDLVNFLNELD